MISGGGRQTRRHHGIPSPYLILLCFLLSPDLREDRPLTPLPGPASLDADLLEALGEERLHTLVLLDIRWPAETAEDDPRPDLVRGLAQGLAYAAVYQIGADRFALLNLPAEQDHGPPDIRGLPGLLPDRVTLSGGGLAVDPACLIPGAETVRLLLATAAELLILASKKGGNRILWIDREEAVPPDLGRVAGRLFENLARVNAARVRQLEIDSRVDPLTGLYNRRGFDEGFARMVETARRSGRPLALLFLDCDTLKEINDEGGHEAGDRFILDLAGVLRSVVRRSDFIVRWGADEFAVALEDGETSKAMVLAERLRTEVEARTEGTISIGIYSGVPADAAEAVSAADAAMYEAKGRGRNVVVSRSRCPR